MDTAVSGAANQPLFDGLKRRFEKHRDAVLLAVDARSRERLRNLENTLELRKQQEISNIGAVLDELAKAIGAELKKEEEPEQLALFSEDERLQVRRDAEALRARLARIPTERAEEIEAIEARFFDAHGRALQADTFVAAMQFLFSLAFVDRLNDGSPLTTFFHRQLCWKIVVISDHGCVVQN